MCLFSLPIPLRYFSKNCNFCIIEMHLSRDVMKFEFEFECWRISNVFAKFEIRPCIVGDACIGFGSHFHALNDAKHAPALNAVNDSQHTSHNVLALWPPAASFDAGREGCCCSGSDHLGWSNSKFSHSCYMKHLAIIIGMAMHLLGLSADFCCKILQCFKFLHQAVTVFM